MQKVLQMPKRERGENPSCITKLPALLEAAKEEQDATTAKINGWLNLADTVLRDSADAPADLLRRA